MARIGSTPFSFPDFRGATRRLVLVNLVAYFVLAVGGAISPSTVYPVVALAPLHS